MSPFAATFVLAASFFAAQDLDGPVRARGATPWTFAGVVIREGLPVEGARVTSSAGGLAITDAHGVFLLELDVPADVARLEIHASDDALGLAQRSIDLAASPTGTWLDPLALVAAPTQLGCPLAWLRTVGGSQGADDMVHVQAVLDDGGGPALYVGGSFFEAGGQGCLGIVRWDGVRWTPLGGGLAAGLNSVRALAAFDDGTGPAIYAGGVGFVDTDFGSVAKWDGTSWAAVGGEAVWPTVEALVVHDDGSGPSLYAGGAITSIGGTPVNTKVVRWDGASWTSVGVGINAVVRALAVFDDGTGPALYAGGEFTTAGGLPANRIARWDGSAWTPLGSGTNQAIYTLQVFDDGSGPALYAGGVFTTAGGLPANHVAKWDGTSWSSLGSGIPGIVYDLALFDAGGGTALHAGGYSTFPTTKGLVARWDGTTWVSEIETSGIVRSLASFAEGSNDWLHLGGAFDLVSSPGPIVVKNIARWDGSAAGPLTHSKAPNDLVLAMTVFDDGAGPGLFVGGGFDHVGAVPTACIAKWDGKRWHPTPGTTNGWVHELAALDTGAGPELYAGGAFTQIGGASANRVARWNGGSWAAMGAGLDLNLPLREIDAVRAFEVFDDGSGPALYAGGSDRIRLQRWNGTSWTRLDVSGHISALEVFDDGTGSALFVGGDFSQVSDAGGQLNVANIARWDGTSWSAPGYIFGDVEALKVFDDGTGPALYVAGQFSGGVLRWDGQGWSSLNQGVFPGRVHTMEVFDDGTGPGLYVGGEFSASSPGFSMDLRGMARWRREWTPLGSGLFHGTPYSLAEFDDGSGPALFVGGDFSTIDSRDRNLARWGCPELRKISPR